MFGCLRPGCTWPVLTGGLELGSPLCVSGPRGPASSSTFTTTLVATTARAATVTPTATMRRVAKRDGTAAGT